MANRKETPDVLGQVLGAEADEIVRGAPQPQAAPEVQAAPKRKPAARRSSPRSKPKPPRWEYMEVVFRDYGGLRPRFVDGEECKNWKASPVIHEYLNHLGEEGWELAGIGGRHKEQMVAYLKRLKG